MRNSCEWNIKFFYKIIAVKEEVDYQCEMNEWMNVFFWLTMICIELLNRCFAIIPQPTIESNFFKW